MHILSSSSYAEPPNFYPQPSKTRWLGNFLQLQPHANLIIQNFNDLARKKSERPIEKKNNPAGLSSEFQSKCKIRNSASRTAHNSLYAL